MATHIGIRGHGRGQPEENMETMEEMRDMRACMEAIEINRQRDPEARDMSEPYDE